MDVLSGAVTYTKYTPGTAAYAEAVDNDYWAGLINLEQREALLFGGGIAPTTAGVRWWPTIKELGDAFNIALTGWAKYSQIEYQKELAAFNLERSKYQLARGMMGEEAVPGFGGLNVWTLLAFGGIAALALFVLKK